MFDAEKYIAEYQQTQHGAARLRAIKTAIQAADEAKNDEWSFRFRERYLNESTFEADDVDALVIFPEMITLYDNSEELQEDPEYQQMLMWSFKLVIENALDFYHIPLSKIEEFFAEYSSRLKKYGYTQRTYLYLREVAAMYTGNMLPEEEFGKYRNEPEDALKDCTACELSHDVRVQLLFGHPEKADEMCGPIFSGELRCGNVPNNTYAAWVEYNIRTGEYNDSRRMAKELYSMSKHEMNFLVEISTLLRYYAAVSHYMGTLIFRNELPEYLACRNHRSRFYFAAAAYQLFKQIDTEGLVLVLSPDFPLWKQDSRYETAELRDYFYNEAKELAEKFDARNGNTFMTDFLNAELPPYEGNADDIVHGETEPSVSAMSAICTNLPDELTLESVARTLDNDGRFKVLLSKTEEDGGLLIFQIGVNDGSHDIYQVAVACQRVPPLDQIRPATPIADDIADAVHAAEGSVLFIMPFEEKQPDLALHFQIKLMHLICPDAVAYVDLTRNKLLPAGWVTLAAISDVPPLVDYLYTLRIYASENCDDLWIVTEGLNCCGLREIEILDATKENFARYCDMLSFAVERILLRQEMENAGRPFTVVRDANDKPVVCTWVTAKEARADYADGTEAGWKVRKEILEEAGINSDGNAVLYLYGGEAADGTPRRKRLNALTEADFESFRYGSYIATSRKIAALAKERIAMLNVMFQKAPENAYACVVLKESADEDEVWIKLTDVEGDKLTGILTCDCDAGKEGTSYTAETAQLTDFSVRMGENLIVHPNTAYIGLEI